MNVTLEEAHREACLALGEAIVAQRLMAGEMQRMAEETVRLRQTAKVQCPSCGAWSGEWCDADCPTCDQASGGEGRSACILGHPTRTSP